MFRMNVVTIMSVTTLRTWRGEFLYLAYPRPILSYLIQILFYLILTYVLWTQTRTTSERIRCNTLIFVDNSTVVVQRRHHPSNTTLSRNIWSTIHAAADAVVDDPARRYCAEDSATSERPQRPVSMIRSRGTLSLNFSERSTANSTWSQSTRQLTYF